MPRVISRTATNRAKKVRSCATCGKPLEEGQKYYTWARRFGRSKAVYYQHTECGYPRPTQLSGRKTAQVEEAISDAETAIGAWTPELPEGSDEDLNGFEPDDTSDVNDALNEVASIARDVASEYEDGVQNMPEGLQQGTTGEAMTEVAQELESWADTLEGWTPSATFSLPDRGDEDETPEDYRERVQSALDDWADEVRNEATDEMGDMPEYQG